MSESENAIRFKMVEMEKTGIDLMNKAFARTMEIFTYIGLILMIAPGLIYIVGNGGLVSVEDAIQNWDKPASEFWKVVNVDPNGYSWFLNNLAYHDCLSILGIAFLAITPLAAIIVAIFKADLKYKIILTIVTAEFIIAILRPLFMHSVGH